MPRPAAHQLFADLPSRPEGELFSTLAESTAVRVERIVSPPGHRGEVGSWYDQERDEWVLLLRGGAALEIAGETELLELAPGDHVVIPAGLRHRVAWTAEDGPTVWLAVHYR